MLEYTVDRRTALLYSGAALTGLTGCLHETPGTESGSDGSPSGNDTDDGHDDEDGHNETEDVGHDDEEPDRHEHSHEHEEQRDYVLGESVDSITVEMVTNDAGYHFIPHVVHVTPGATVTWKLNSGSHDSVAYHSENDRPLRMPDEAEPWASELFSESGAKFERSFDVEGVYDYYCTPHENLGMVGRVVVGDPDLHDEPAMAAPQDEIPPTARESIREFNTRVEDALGHH